MPFLIVTEPWFPYASPNTIALRLNKTELDMKGRSIFKNIVLFCEGLKALTICQITQLGTLSFRNLLTPKNSLF